MIYFVIDISTCGCEKENQKSGIELEGNPCYATVERNAELTENICYSKVGKMPDSFDNSSNSAVYETIH